MLALIDFDIMCYRYGFAAQKKDKTTGALIVQDECTVYKYLDAGIDSILYHTNADDYVGYLSGDNNFRLDVDPEYKANRKDAEKPYHYDNIKKYLITCHDAVITDRIEADDAMGIRQDDNTIICTIDKDLDQVPGWHYDFVKNNKYYITPQEADWWFWMQMLMGDTVDNIKGIKGIGPKKAEKLLDVSKDYYETVSSKYAEEYGEKEGYVQFRKNLRLVEILKEEPIRT